jgi:hypothetical protein
VLTLECTSGRELLTVVEGIKLTVVYLLCPRNTRVGHFQSPLVVFSQEHEDTDSA